MGLEPVANLNHRLSTIGKSEGDNLMHRGHVRLFQNPQCLAVDAGEGGVMDRPGPLAIALSGKSVHGSRSGAGVWECRVTIAQTSPRQDYEAEGQND